MPKKPGTKSLKKAKEHTTPATMEAMMSQLAQILAAGKSGEMVMPGDLKALMASLGGPSAFDRLSEDEADAKSEAQQIAFDAMEAESEVEARKLARRALRLDPDCVDALVVMADLDAHSPRESIEGLQKAVAAGERSLGETFIREIVPELRLLGLEPPDPELRFDEGTGRWVHGPIDFDELKRVVNGDGPCNAARIGARIKAHEDGAWVREAMLAYPNNHELSEAHA